MKRLLFALGAAALQTAKSPLHIRGLLSCEDTYGEGSQQCGPPDSGFCYTPSKGQVRAPRPHLPSPNSPPPLPSAASPLMLVGPD